ncbi:ComEC/Rec2 family competence protein [Paracoccus sediminicola]|uniref:ComEC/Rec2 family competence protein n=1 Tax=Paracoccus sediminicola TaxID=3017783 RepID=UPI0022F0EC03|nr:ComEC/Rec2 family competence protein [Paracoccus sediminicola]WBU57720.1 ComEC/Rec2 family competence protein [Paracoccus sediminicola]
MADGAITRAARQGARPSAGQHAAGDAVARAGLMPWAPCWMGCGIGLWFLLPAQPRAGAAVAAVLSAAIGLWLWRLRREDSAAQALRLFGFALMLAASGFGLTSLRAARVEAPVLTFRYYGPVEGRVIEIDRSGRDRLRLTLDQVRISRIAPENLPLRVRLSLPDGVRATPPPGTRVMLTGHLGPPPGPAEPGGFDFRRAAWFERLGAIGYTRAPVMIAAPPEPGGAMRLHRLRMRLSAAMQDRIGGQEGAVAAALMTGDRSGISEATNRMMRDSNLYHIISISGLHMGMLAGFVYAALRLLVVAVQAVTQRGTTLPAHKIAALGGIIAAGGYLWLSGGGVATERAFLMVAVMLGAILADRRALSLRTVALAAVVILALAPEALLTPGFQMSFAATVALILIYPPWLRWGRRLPWLVRPVAMLVLSSVVAGFATSPIAAAHFSRMAHYGVLANLLVVPVTGVLIMPMGPVAALLAPLGLEGPALWLMGRGTEWMLAVGAWIAGLDGAVSYVVQPGPWVLPLMGLGALLTLLSARDDRPPWRNARQLAGAAMILAAALSWLSTPRPALLISRDGDAVGLMTSQGRAVSKPKGGSFTVREWLEKDGDIATQAEAASRPGWTGQVKRRMARMGGAEIWHLTGKGSDRAAAEICAPGRLILSDQDLSGLSGGCLVFDALRLRDTGAVSWRGETLAEGFTTTRQVTGLRPWSY